MSAWLNTPLTDLEPADRSSVRQCRKARQFFAESRRLKTFSSITVFKGRKPVRVPPWARISTGQGAFGPLTVHKSAFYGPFGAVFVGGRWRGRVPLSLCWALCLCSCFFMVGWASGYMTCYRLGGPDPWSRRGLGIQSPGREPVTCAIPSASSPCSNVFGPRVGLPPARWSGGPESWTWPRPCWPMLAKAMSFWTSPFSCLIVQWAFCVDCPLMHRASVIFGRRFDRGSTAGQEGPARGALVA
ncbi:hypothetical protein ABH924_004694 [Arthrobacter sp. GAS37]